ncbi:MAG: IS4 family transposase [Cyanobacteria bacterium P01_F01_bin.150]
MAPFNQRLSPLIKDTLSHFNKRERKGTKLVSSLVVWLVLALTIRRDLNTHAVLDWMLSGWRWLSCSLPKQLVADGTISHARMRVGNEVFRHLFYRVVSTFKPITADFHQWVSVAFDGSTGKMPDTPANQKTFGKSNNQRKGSAYPQLRWVRLLAIGPRLLLDVAYGPYSGKGNGERSLMMQILKRLKRVNLLFMVDAGLYSFAMMDAIHQQECAFLLKVSGHPSLPVLKRLNDGSYISEMSKMVDEPGQTSSTRKRKRRKKKTIKVRVIPYQIPGFRAARLVTNILDTSIRAKALVLHYHKRWDIEVCFDEIKTHQCATLRGQMPTLFRSKRPELVVQELYGMMIAYNLIRELMLEAAQNQQEALSLSFLDSLQFIIDAVPQMSKPNRNDSLIEVQQRYLLSMLADARIDRPRRPRVNPRVVKVKMSKFKRKTSKHKTQIRHLEKEVMIIPPEAA